MTVAGETLIACNKCGVEYPATPDHFYFQRNYFRHRGASGDVRAHYEDLDFTSTGSGEVLRVRGIANGTDVATGGTVNAIHTTVTGRAVTPALPTHT